MKNKLLDQALQKGGELLKKGKVILLIACIICLGLILTAAAPPKEGFKYVGNSKTKVFHTPACKTVKAMADKNAVYFKDIEEAVKKGFKPCKVCKPK
jgi:hypothetical protein